MKNLAIALLLVFSFNAYSASDYEADYNPMEEGYDYEEDYIEDYNPMEEGYDYEEDYNPMEEGYDYEEDYNTRDSIIHFCLQNYRHSDSLANSCLRDHGICGVRVVSLRERLETGIPLSEEEIIYQCKILSKDLQWQQVYEMFCEFSLSNASVIIYIGDIMDYIFD